MNSDLLEFEEMEENLHKLFDDIKIDFNPKTVLAVTVVGVRDVSVSYIRDKLDEPDPQVVVTCPTLKPPNKFQTATQSNSPTCLINETFQFVLPEDLKPGESFPVEVSLYDVDILFDDFLGTKKIDVAKIKAGDSLEQTISFGKHGEVDMKFRKYVKTTPDLRLSLTLHPEERHFRKKRIPVVMETLKKLNPEPQAPRSLKETPVVSVVASGGGYRAMVGMCGAMKAFEDAGIMDAFTYVIGASGSAWYLSSAYACKMTRRQGQDFYHYHLQQKFQDNLLVDSILPAMVTKYRRYSSKLKKYFQPTSLVDFWGFNVARKIIVKKDQHEVRLSELQDFVRDGNSPFPILAAVNLRNTEPEYKYYAYLDKSPFEISLPKFGIGIDPKRFGSVFSEGVLVRECPEHPLHFIQGSCGSAFAILLGAESDKDPEFIDLIAELEVKSDKTISDEINIADEDDESSEDEDDVEAADVEEADVEEADVEETDVEEADPKGRGWIKVLGNLHIFNDRTFGITRTGRIFNPAKGINLKKTFNIDPHATGPTSDEKNPGLNEELLESYLLERKKKISTKASVISLADAAIHNNVPLELALRPQRQCDVIIVLDFSAQTSDEQFSYEELYKASTSAYVQGLKFPTVDYKWISQLPPKEFIWIQGADDEPEVLWFTLSNKKFKEQKDYKAKFLKPVSEDGSSFHDFNVFNGGFPTFKVEYTQLEFDRIQELMYFNVTSHMEEIKQVLARGVEKRRRRECEMA